MVTMLSLELSTFQAGSIEYHYLIDTVLFWFSYSEQNIVDF